MIHLLKLHPSTNMNQVSLHLRRHAFLISQPCASFHQDPGLIFQSTVISFAMCHSGPNISCQESMFSHHSGAMTNLSQRILWATCGRTMTWVPSGNWPKAGQISHTHQSTLSIHQNVDMAISLGIFGMFGKACWALHTHGKF